MISMVTASCAPKPAPTAPATSASAAHFEKICRSYATKLAATDERTLALPADLMASSVDTGVFGGPGQANPCRTTPRARVKLHDDHRVIPPAGDSVSIPRSFPRDWTTPELLRVFWEFAIGSLTRLPPHPATPPPTSPELRAKGWCNASAARAPVASRHRAPEQTRRPHVKLRPFRLPGPIATLATQPCVGGPALHHNPASQPRRRCLSSRRLRPRPTLAALRLPTRHVKRNGGSKKS